VQRTGSILVVDNEPTIVDLIVEILTDEGYVAYAAPDGASALTTIAHHPPALLLLDVRMPGMSGAELIAVLRGAGLAPMPMVLMTTAPRDAAPLLVPGLIECLVKPFDLDELLTCIARYVLPPQQRINDPLRVTHAPVLPEGGGEKLRSLSVAPGAGDS
jgi:CheY-like chemotaxis protein